MLVVMKMALLIFTSLQYFVNENPNIAVNNKIVKDLSALLKI